MIEACASLDCQKAVCEHCQIEAPNRQFYCLQCYSSKPELQKKFEPVQENEEDEDDDDGVMSFDPRSSQASSGFVKTAGVKYDKASGQFIEEGNFYEMIGGAGA